MGLRLLCLLLVAGGFFTTSAIWEANPHTNDLLSQFLLPDASGVFFNKKLQGMLKDKRNNLKRKEVFVQILELSDKEFNNYD